jgi:hypothetical protein
VRGKNGGCMVITYDLDGFRGRVTPAVVNVMEPIEWENVMGNSYLGRIAEASASFSEMSREAIAK